MKDEALGLPIGSIRAILALILVLSACAGFFLGKVSGEFIAGLTGTAIGFYFGSKVAKPNSP